MSDALTATQMALARTQKLNDLGGVVAAAAHELGTPLATIKLASAELADDLADRPEVQEDIQLIRDQTDRCRDILRTMGQAGKDDMHMRTAPLVAVLEEAAEPHQNRGRDIFVSAKPRLDGTEAMPQIIRRPEIIHGLRNLVQNAVDFAQASVRVDARWTRSDVTIRIVDDGEGFPPHLLGRIGDPFVGGKRVEQASKSRGEYEGMGLGLFIAKTLLERSGATLHFANGTRQSTQTDDPNGSDRIGAIVEVRWPLDAIIPQDGDGRSALGENPNFT